MDINDLTVRQVREIAGLAKGMCSDGPTQQTPCPDGALRIVILHRGHVVVGRVHYESGEVVVSGCAVVRRWGTTKGLGEIAAGGPTSKTVLDECPPVRVHPLAIIAQMDCDGAKWDR